MCEDTFKGHERYLILAVEKVNQQSMEKAVTKKGQLTLGNIDEIKKYLLGDWRCLYFS